MSMSFVGDRFVALPGGRWRDLATGSLVAVLLTDDSAPAVVNARRAGLRVVDEGPCGLSHRFVACQPRDHSDDDPAWETREAALMVARSIARLGDGSAVTRVRVASSSIGAFAGAVATTLRSQGFVTLRPGLDLPDTIRRHLLHRHLCLLSFGGGERNAAAAWLRALHRVSARSHLVVLVEAAGCDEPAAPPVMIREARPSFVLAAMAESPPAEVAERLARARRQAARGRLAGAERWHHAALECARRRRDDAAAVEACRELVRWLRRQDRWDDALRRVRQTLAATVRAPARLELFALMAEIQIAHAECRSAELTIAAAYAEAEVVGVPVPASLCTARAELRFWQGRLDEASALARAATGTTAMAMVRGLTAWLRRDVEEMERSVGRLAVDDRPEAAVRRAVLAALLAALRNQSVAVRTEVWLFERLLPRVRCPRLGRLARLFLNEAMVLSGGDAALHAPPSRAAPMLDRLLFDWQEACRARDSAAEARAAVALGDAGIGIVRVWRWGNRNMHLIHAIPRLLELVQDAEDERAALVAACGWARREAGATAAAFLGADRSLVASDRWTAADTGALCASAMTGDRTADAMLPSGEAAVVARIRYAGVAIGFMALRGDMNRLASLRDAADAAAAVCGAALRARLDLLANLDRAPALAGEILGRSPAIVALRESIVRIASTPFPVLIEGESGTGKELVARAIHRLSPRRDRRFAAVNAAALTEDLVEAELFGHSRGAFTGAVAPRAGLFEDAHGGSLFLDEVSDLSARAQAKLLRVLQEREVRRVGENAARAVDVRMIAASNRPLAERVRAGAFREDLRFRLAVIVLRLPPLRDRLEDVPVLAHAIWRRLAADANKRTVLGPDAVARLCRHTWPGNVRELQNALAALIVSAPDRGRVSARHVNGVLAGAADEAIAPPRSMDEARAEGERTAVLGALARHGGRRTPAARELGLSRQGLAKAMKRLGLDDRRREEGAA